ncbi:MAG TPA: pyruvate kinase [Armatimonadota bacterium]|jgi:pyruvate kinase
MYDANPTKMICTVGPASSSPEVFAQLLDAGLDVARLNFSHGTHAQMLEVVRMIRELGERKGRHVALLADLQGPKIRTGALEGDAPVLLETGNQFVITIAPVAGTAACVSTTYQSLPQDVKPGDTILLDDGLIALEVLSSDATEVTTCIRAGGWLGAHKGINLPGVAISSPSLTEKDRADLDFILQHDLDYIGLSFVRCAEDVRQLKQLVAASGCAAAVIAKIEKPEALEEIEEIVEEADGIMVARGDLGVEMPPEQVPILQKRITALCGQRRKPVIIATQMLDSMREHPRPTRAEASDVANAIFSGADAVMLSGETAAGQYPVESALMMQRIAAAAEADLLGGAHLRTAAGDDEFFSFADAIARSAAEVAESVGAAAIVAFTHSGSTARLISMCRTRVPIFAATPLVSTARRCHLYWGVRPVLIAPVQDTDEMIINVTRTMKAMGVVKPGDVIVITAGTPVGQAGGTDTVKLQTII